MCCSVGPAIDRLVGGDGDDTVTGGTGVDIGSGGAGDDGCAVEYLEPLARADGGRDRRPQAPRRCGPVRGDQPGWTDRVRGRAQRADDRRVLRRQRSGPRLPARRVRGRIRSDVVVRDRRWTGERVRPDVGARRERRRQRRRGHRHHGAGRALPSRPDHHDRVRGRNR